MRLEIGAPNFGSMLKDSDLVEIFTTLSNLRNLKLVFCHLLSSEGWIGCVASKSSVHLRSLTLWRMKAPFVAINLACPNIEELKVGGKCIINSAEELKELPAFANLKKLYLGELILPRPIVGPNDYGPGQLTPVLLTIDLLHWQELKITHLWIGDNGVTQQNQLKILQSIKSLRVFINGQRTMQGEIEKENEVKQLPKECQVLTPKVLFTPTAETVATGEHKAAFYLLWSETY